MPILLEIGPVILEKKSSMYFHCVAIFSLLQSKGIGKHLNQTSEQINMWKDLDRHLDRQTDHLTMVMIKDIKLLSDCFKVWSNKEIKWKYYIYKYLKFKWLIYTYKLTNCTNKLRNASTRVNNYMIITTLDIRRS